MVGEVWSQELQSVLNVHGGPLADELHGGVRLQLRGPVHALDELAERLLVAGEVVAEPPEQVLLLAGQGLGGRVAQDGGQTVPHLGVRFQLPLHQAGPVGPGQLVVLLLYQVLEA